VSINVRHFLSRTLSYSNFSLCVGMNLATSTQRCLMQLRSQAIKLIDANIAAHVMEDGAG